ncbi:MAG: hypothetical protein EXS09_13700 [Gemmataceae bacterium]|nr:hypothetical protein [Gemmataceae bacterium]
MARRVEHGRHRGPRHIVAAGRQEFGQQSIESQGLPQSPGEPDIAAASVTFELYAAQIVVEQTGLTFDAHEAIGQAAVGKLTLGIEFAAWSDGLLTHFAADADGPHEPPVSVRLAAASNRGVPQIHAELP